MLPDNSLYFIKFVKKKGLDQMSLVSINQPYRKATANNKYNKIGGIVRKHLTGGFLRAVLDLSGILRFLLIPEYSGIKRRGKPLRD